MNLQAERELFEKTMFTDSFMFSTIWHDDEYMDLYTQSMWQSWLASRNREGYVLVPVDKLDHAIGWYFTVEAEWSGAADLTEDEEIYQQLESMIKETKNEEN